MPRGYPDTEGVTRISQNGYQYTKTPQGWVLTHRLIAEEMLGRRILSTEMVKFKNGDRTDLRPENIIVIETEARKVYTSKRREASLIARILDLYACLLEVNPEAECPICQDQSNSSEHSEYD